jgi:aryl-alcohol dehydrogenase-like predicted oxidoreductase
MNKRQLGTTGLLVSYSPQGAGVLTGRYLDRMEAQGRLHELGYYARRYADPVYSEVARGFCQRARELGCSPGGLALKWAAAHPAVTSPLIGARTLAQLEDTLSAWESIDLTPALYERITALSPTPPPAHDRLEEQASPVFYAPYSRAEKESC